MTQLVKMSKSSGNAIGVDQVVYMVWGLPDGYEFRDLQGEIVDWKWANVWFDVSSGYRMGQSFNGSGNFQMGRRLALSPVFLHLEGWPIPAYLNGRDVDGVQHQQNVVFWSRLRDKWEKIIDDPNVDCEEIRVRFRGGE